VSEPAADLAAAAALVSSLTGHSLPHDRVFFGEIGLSGAIRPVALAVARLKEAAKLGFTSAMMPPAALDAADALVGNVTRHFCAHIADLVTETAAPREKNAARAAARSNQMG
jgi:DNA repair protein RadA/Sms